MHEILHFPVKVIQSKVLFVTQRLWNKEENMMSNTNDLLNRINNCYSSMSKGQKLLATYITDNYDKAVFLTAAKMGETVGVSESTVVRFATYLGYKGYPEFQRALEELVRNKLITVRLRWPSRQSLRQKIFILSGSEAVRRLQVFSDFI